MTALNVAVTTNTTLFVKATDAAEAKAIAHELALVMTNTYVQFSAISLYVLFGPVLELAKRRRCLSSLFLRLPSLPRIELAEEHHDIHERMVVAGGDLK